MSSPVKTSPALYDSSINREGQVPIDATLGGLVSGGSRFVPVDVKDAYVTNGEGEEIPQVTNDGGDQGEFKHIIPSEGEQKTEKEVTEPTYAEAAQEK